MGAVFVNFSNHPSEKWTDEQFNEARKYGDVVDIPFPEVSPYFTEAEVEALANDCISKIAKTSPSAVMCQGEFTLCFSVVSKLREKNIKCVAACSDRRVNEVQNLDGTTSKSVVFDFVRFREY